MVNKQELRKVLGEFIDFKKKEEEEVEFLVNSLVMNIELEIFNMIRTTTTHSMYN